jgi:outer membrane protein OmpA-like peptidoglycan-associated protein
MRPVARVALVAALVVAGCAKAPAPPVVKEPSRDDLYVLLPDQTGKTGALSVTHEGQDHVLDTPHAATSIKDIGQVEKRTAHPDEVKQAFGAALAAQPPRPVSFTLYFLEGKDEFTPESNQVIQTLLAELARRPAPEVVVIGHTDRVGSVPYNDALSLRRAERARAELAKAGIPLERIQIAGRGEREPLVPTEDEVAEPRNRRVEISIR